MGRFICIFYIYYPIFTTLYNHFDIFYKNPAQCDEIFYTFYIHYI